MTTITLPTLHAGQAAIYAARTQYNAVRCGRRWGKTKLMVTIGGSAVAKGHKVGIFAPEHKQLHEPFDEMLDILYPVRAASSQTKGVIKATTGGQADFWSLNDNELAGRGREYDDILIDEGAFTKNGQMLRIWERSIKPTMLTRPNARVWIFSTPNGDSPENFFWRVCNDPEMGFKEHYAPSSSNPMVEASYLEAERKRCHPLVFDQEYLAKFVDFSGEAFFTLDRLLVDGQPVEFPATCDSVFAVIDTAVKAGKEHDATAVSYWAFSPRHGPHPLVCLDWDLVSIDGALLETWIPSVFARASELARMCKARFGSTGAWIEDAQSGSILLQQCALRGLPAAALPSNLTAAGKDARAINVSGAVYRGEVKFSRYAYDKNDISFKGVTRNHMLSQVTGFRVGDKQAATRSDDLLDTFTYAVAIALGDSEGIA